MENGKAWYRYTVNRLNNMLDDSDGFDIYEKFFLKGVEGTRKYIGNELADKLMYLHGLVKNRRNRILFSMLAVIILQQPILFKLRKIAF